MSRHPTLVRIGEGEFYEDFNIRFNPAIQTARDGRLGNRLIDDDKLNFAPRAGWAWTPSDRTSIRAGVGMFYMQDTGNPRFDMARNAAGRRQDTSDQFFNQNWNAPFVGSGTNACGVQPPLVCISNHYVLGNDFDRTTPRMLQYLFNVQRELGRNAALEVGYLGSRSYQLERMFDRNEVIPGAGGTQDPTAIPGVHPDSDDRQRRRSQVQLADGQADAASRQRLLGARRLHALEVRGQRQRHPHAQRRRAVPAEQQLRGG